MEKRTAIPYWKEHTIMHKAVGFSKSDIMFLYKLQRKPYLETGVPQTTSKLQKATKEIKRTWKQGHVIVFLHTNFSNLSHSKTYCYQFKTISSSF